MSNKKIGNDFEHELCERLATFSFWAYNTINKASGQPVDIIACKNGIPILIDAKVCSNDYFLMSRVEENQTLAMGRFKASGNNQCWFALQLPNKRIYMLSYDIINDLHHQEYRKLFKEDIMAYGVPFDKWVMGFCE